MPNGDMELDSVQQAAQAQFAKRSQSYGSSHILADVSDVEAALDHISIPAGVRVLDIATGAGHTALLLASRGCVVTASDLADPMLERVREAGAARKLKVETRQHAAEDLPYAAASFDLVTCRVAAHHFSSPREFVRESARVLRHEGWFLLIDGSVEDDQPEAEEWMHQVEKLRDPSHHRMLSPRAWTRLCEQHGLKVRSASLMPFKQPDLDWYFETAATSAENRELVRELIRTAPASARQVYGLTEELGKVVWWWRRLTLLAQK